MFEKKQGDAVSFDSNWKSREESLYTHWTRGELENQIQLAFRNHWTLFKELMENEPANKLSIETRENIVLPLITIQQYALQIVKEIESGDIRETNKSVFEKIITRSLYGNINASRNSA